METQANKH
jgi:hypothetical protein